MRVLLPDVPSWENDAIRAQPGLLDGYAQDYAGSVAEPEIERFLYGWLPVRAFDAILSGSVAESDRSGTLWLFHCSGYFGGVWLRGELDRAQPRTHSVAGVHVEPTAEAFAETVARARAALDVVHAEDRAVLEYNESSLFPTGDGALTDGLVDNFGYNQGYLLEILSSPPDGVTPGAHSIVTCAGPLSCSYTTPKLEALRELADVEEALLSGADATYADLAARIAPVQDAAVPRGRAVWSGLLSVQGFDQDAYDTLVDVSSSYLEDVQATALASVRAIAEADAGLGRRAAVADAAMTVWLAGYGAGLVEGRDPDDVPTLVLDG